jgi:hypothetical protein
MFSSFCVLTDILFSRHLYWWYLWMLAILLSVDPVLNVAADEDADTVALFLWRPRRESSEVVNESSFWCVPWKETKHFVNAADWGVN